MLVPDNKDETLDDASEKVKFIQKKHWLGFLTENEKKTQSIKVWAKAKNKIEDRIKTSFPASNHIFHFIDSGAR
jgi:DNA-directed RNA polymerase beta' subunit